LEASGLAEAFCRELGADLEEKFSAQRNGLQLSATDIVRHGILFEGFRVDTYLSSGVAPKRYFGFFDEQGDTAEYEKEIRATVIDGVRIANEYAVSRGLKSRLSEMEVAITFLAEGGALLLTNPESSPNRVHPVRGIGLDNFRIGFKRFPMLVDRFDGFFGTKLNSLLLTIAGRSILLRPMTFREAILGTTLMYLYEKELAASMMEKEWDAALMSLSLPEQFITTSLVYNSGILFSRERVAQIERFATGEYLATVNQTATRPRLAVYHPDESLRRLRGDKVIPRQLTSWNAVYHILQRYGAWVAMERFSDIFRDGEYRCREITRSPIRDRNYPAS